VRILVVSDDAQIQQEAKFGFASDVEIVSARDAREAAALLSERPDLVIVDLQSGNAGGYALARDMSQSQATADVPILMLLEREQDDWLARQAGAARVRVKPITSALLVEDALSLIRQLP
jgi:two-component system phosphate regulon response regulator PhoB